VAVSFDIVVGGDYTLVSEAPAVIDGSQYEAGSTLRLEPGAHVLQTATPAHRIRMLWGRNTRIPPEVPSPLPVFFGYGGG
jgi:hypothetical protein